LTPVEEFVDSTVGGSSCWLQGYRITIRHVEIHRSARKHGVSDTDITHAYENAAVQLDYDPDEHPPRFALVGPDTAGNYIELVALVADDDRIIVIHAMKARPHFLALLREQENPT
jgi:hypothetical protein